MKTQREQKHDEALLMMARGDEECLYFRDPHDKSGFVHVAASHDGRHYRETKRTLRIITSKGSGERNQNIVALSMSEILGQGYFLTYLLKGRNGKKSLCGAVSKGGLAWNKIGKIATISEHGVFSPVPRNLDTPFALYYGERAIKLATSSNLKNWSVKRGSLLAPRANHFDSKKLSPAYAAATPHGILLLYTAQDHAGRFGLGGAIFDAADPSRLLFRISVPLFESSDRVAPRFLGAIKRGPKLVAYFQKEDGSYFAVSLPVALSRFAVTKRRSATHRTTKGADFRAVFTILPVFERFFGNPILEPRSEHHWESLAAFNAAALELDGRVHLLYRAQGFDGLSVLGYASSSDGVSIDDRLTTPAYIPSQAFDTRKKDVPFVQFPYLSGGGWGGCEDPRVTRIGNRIYLIYTAFNGAAPPGVALTSISVSDFRKKRWNWRKPKLISRAGQIHKNWVIFPEKIGGKYTVLHNVTPFVMLESLDSLEKDGLIIDSCPPRQDGNRSRWDNNIRGAGAPPLRTDKGWLLFYHAMDFRDPDRYKIGALLLDLDDPTKIIARAPEPVLEPNEWYENHGHKWGVVYVCGAVIKDDTLFIYYGASDRTLAVATAPLRSFVDALAAQKTAKLTPVTLSKS